ncbi:MAG: hypothetical protein HC859_08420, partial [Bacteroidia bacterium]|nr:hypothetical protein [Bacteroidia bacterium]
GVVTNDDALANDTYENLKAVPLPVRYTVTPYNVDGVTGHQCPGNTQIVTLSVKPEPQLDPNLDKAICSDAETEITLVSAPNTFPADKFIIESIASTGLTLIEPTRAGHGHSTEQRRNFRQSLGEHYLDSTATYIHGASV